MKGVIFSQVGAAPEVVQDLAKSVPGEGQVLVKSLWTAINPVDAFMASMGLLVLEWPLVLGVDAAGSIASVHHSVSERYPHLSTGTIVFGCTRLGQTQYSTAQEYYLMDAALLVPKPSNITVQQAATLGVSCYTACLGLFQGLDIDLPNLDNLPAPASKGGWILVQGGASSVGKSAVQIALACGYRVIASCSPRSAPIVEELGEDVEVFDYSLPLAGQVAKVLTITGGQVHKVFDAVASDVPDLAQALFKHMNNNEQDAETKWFTTTNDWSGIGSFEGCRTHPIGLGPIGRPDAIELNKQIESYVPLIYGLVDAGRVKPSEVMVVGDGVDAWKDALEAYNVQRSGKGGNKKVVVQIGNENE